MATAATAIWDLLQLLMPLLLLPAIVQGGWRQRPGDIDRRPSARAAPGKPTPPHRPWKGHGKYSQSSIRSVQRAASPPRVGQTVETANP